MIEFVRAHEITTLLHDVYLSDLKRHMMSVFAPNREFNIVLLSITHVHKYKDPCVRRVGDVCGQVPLLGGSVHSCCFLQLTGLMSLDPIP